MGNGVISIQSIYFILFHPHLFELHHWRHLLWFASHGTQTIQASICPCQRLNGTGPPLSSRQPRASIRSEAAAVHGAGKRSEIRVEGVFRHRDVGCRRRSVSQGAGQIRAGTEDHSSSGAARHPACQEISLIEVRPIWRWHVDRAVSAHGYIIRDLETDYSDRLEGNHTANKHRQSTHAARMMPRSRNSIYGSRNIISLFS